MGIILTTSTFSSSLPDHFLLLVQFYQIFSSEGVQMLHYSQAFQDPIDLADSVDHRYITCVVQPIILRFCRLFISVAKSPRVSGILAYLLSLVQHLVMIVAIGLPTTSVPV